MMISSWASLGRIALTGLLVYVAVVIFLRVTGKRTLSKWNAFDFIVTIALGSTLATALLSKQTTVLEGMLGLALLMGLQFVVTWLSVRSDLVQYALKSEPTLLLHEGQFRHDEMRRERVTESEVRAALRAHGIGAVEEVDVVVLETEGTFSIIEDLDARKASALEGVSGFEPTVDR